MEAQRKGTTSRPARAPASEATDRSGPASKAAKQVKPTVVRPKGATSKPAKPTAAPAAVAKRVTVETPAPRRPRRSPSPAAIRSISHDIRNLLTAVRGHAELALRGLGADDPVREDVAHVVVVTASVFEMVDLLDGAAASDGQLSTGMDVTVSGMRRLLDALLPAQVELEIEADSDRARVTLSRLRLERIVLNLVMNARDAMVEGGRLVVGTRLLGERAELTVTDSGPGFSKDALAHLFVEGFTTKGDRGGSGRGLAAVHAIVRGAGGSVEVESVLGQGATVIVRLPLAPPLVI